MCPPKSFSDHRISASRKICAAPQKDFFDSINPQQTSERQLVSALLARTALLSSGAFLAFAPRSVVA